ncbi:MAG TPA: hypothetical protein VHY36_01055 [Steroidobacteraceae bacterium]|jgi:hypothetical protein|nr:hypothetical protein [Steroidobacteraceae bacterium]
MTRIKRLGGTAAAAICLQTFAAVLLWQPAVVKAAVQSVDQQHAFDFHFGTWRTHILSRASATKWVKMTGTVIDQPLWGGKANLEKIEASGAGSHFQGLTLFLYNPKSGQWSQQFAASSDGIMEDPVYGKFENGRGVLYGWSGDGQKILERDTWSNVTPNSYHFEIASSADGGGTWVKEFIAQLTRLKKDPDYDTPHSPGSGSEHDFDFNLGRWKTQIRAVLNPLSAPGVWTNLEGTHTVYRVWDDWADIGQLEVDGPSGHEEDLALRMYDRKTQQWRVYFANSSSGTLDQPMVGEFKDGVGTFVFLDEMEGKTVLVRNVWSGITAKSCHQAWALSVDGGKSWVPTWVSTDTLGN